MGKALLTVFGLMFLGLVRWAVTPPRKRNRDMTTFNPLVPDGPAPRQCIRCPEVVLRPEQGVGGWSCPRCRASYE